MGGERRDRPAWQSAISGAIGGMSGLVAGQPFDFVKTMVQDGHGSPRRVVLHTLRKDGVTGFFRGMLLPLVGIAPIFATYFAVFDLMRITLDTRFYGCDRGGRCADHVLHSAAAGAAAGVAVSPAMALGERVKCVLQAHSSAASISTSRKIDPISAVARATGRGRAPIASAGLGPATAVRVILQNGGYRSLFRAAGVTAVREIVAGAAFFGAFEMGMQALQQNGHQQDSNSNDAFAQFLCGGMGGVCRWVASIPIDTVKTVMQTQLPPHDRSSALSEAKRVVRTRGVAALYSGLGTMVLRSFPSGGSMLFAVACTNSILDQYRALCTGGGAAGSRC